MANLITPRARKNKGTAHMLVNARKDHSIRAGRRKEWDSFLRSV